MQATFASLLTSRRFAPLFATQFLGAFNDNLLKSALAVLVTYRLAPDAGYEPASLVMVAGALFIAPFFLLFVQHGQLSKLASDTPTPVTVMHAVIAGAIAAGEIPAQDATLATALAMGIVLQPMTFAAYGRLPQAQAPTTERLIAAAWAAVTTV